MIIAITVKNKLGFMDGSITKPADTDLKFSSWIRNNNVVISCILNFVQRKSLRAFYLLILLLKNDMHERFQHSNGPHIFQLHRELLNLSRGQHLVDVYFTKLKTLWITLVSSASDQ